jgi:O-antigen ligase
MALFNTIAAALIALIAIPLILGTSVKNPKLTALAIIAVLFLFSSSTWGQLEIQNTIYSRGSGELYFSLINVFLFIAGSAVLVRKLADPFYPSIAPPISNYFRAFAFLLAAHAIVGVVSGVNFWTTLGYSGIINVLNMLIFMYLAIMAFREEKDRNKLLAAIIVIAGLRAVFGLVRYHWFGGDSANPYQNFERLDIKLVFFDMSDNFVASLAAFCAAWLLTSPYVKLSMFKRLALYGYLALEVAAVTLSFRRSALLGLGLMFVFLIMRLPGRRRLRFLVIGGAIVFVVAAVFFEQRLQFASKGQGNILTSLIYDITPDKSIESGSNRFYELYAAAKSIGNNWLFGLGTWGTFVGDQDALSYHFGRFDFVHSGFGHIILKTGLVGLALFLGLLYQFCKYYFRHCNQLAGTSRLLADAGFAGFLFWLPTLMIGTPIIEFRTMLLIGLTLALPFIAVGMTSYRPARLYSYAAA